MRFFSSQARPRLTDSGEERQGLLLRALKATGMMFAAIAVGLLGTGGTYAYLNASATAAPASIVNAGTATLSTVGTPAIAMTSLYPGGPVRTGTFLVSNTGDVDLSLSVASFTGPTPANGLVVTASRTNCGTAQVTAGGSLGTLAAGAAVNVCLTVSLPSNAPLSAKTTTPTTISTLITGTQS